MFTATKKRGRTPPGHRSPLRADLCSVPGLCFENKRRGLMKKRGSSEYRLSRGGGKGGTRYVAKRNTWGGGDVERGAWNRP